MRLKSGVELGAWDPGGVQGVRLNEREITNQIRKVTLNAGLIYARRIDEEHLGVA